ncbi:MAG: Co2+/Mg2+ efflux protein ApaG [Gammaproteobacteria bacterium]|nr:Co2+/Mg2+ efflux protein ApaG [Gammaproteobacteria bacterium]
MIQQKIYDIQVHVKPQYLPDQSSPTLGRYTFAYTVTITNTGNQAARLLSRHWIITDATGKVQETRGEGVVGETPYLRPGDSYEYTSGTVMDSPVGCMEGSYQMLADDGIQFDATIPAFTLSIPRALH